MEAHSIPTLFFIAVILWLSDCAALDTITANQEIKDSDTLVSEKGMFELGFFSPGKSNNRYLGIWYKNISNGTVVWVANRETPITDKSGMLKLSSQGNLVILSGGKSKVWSSNSSVSMRSNDTAVMVQLLDTGNLVVWNKNKNSTKQNVIWQSFDYPGDTYLPGMKLGKDLETGLQRFMTSWKSPEDPSVGAYCNIVDTNGYPQTLEWQGQVLQARLGPWNGLGFSGFPIEKENQIYSLEFVINEKEIYHKYELKSSIVLRVVLTWDGKTLLLHWIERLKDWVVYADIIVDSCARFSLCGPYGICSINKHPPCTCMHGFEPRNPEQWEASDWVSGCIRKKPLNCGNVDGFWKLAGVKVPDTRRSWYNVSMTLGECEMTCRSNCSCTGYASLDIRNGGSGCLIWFDELIDTREYDANQDIYVRMAASELEGHVDSQSDFNEKKIIVIVVLLTSSAVPLLLVVAFTCRKIKKRPHVKGQGNRYVLDEKNTSLQMEHVEDLQLFSLAEVARSTDNFSLSNKLGEGGFGPVYKGVLEGGREIAVKRLSQTSQQGLDEFKNEVICISKLQHRNLVKLLGYCIHKNELILIYEYMTNKSLDFFLFDETRTLMLNWPQRFHIIHGHDATSKTKKVVGTHGYISPEYALYGCFSIKSDVFSFGVMVLEIISGKRNREFSHGEHKDNLLGHAWRLYKDGRSNELISGSLQATCVISEVLRSMHVALLCVQHNAEDRPTMLSVVLMLVSDGALPDPKHPAFFTQQSYHELESFPSINQCTMTLLYDR
ncbi:hypothetical protein L1987_27303 [Smallanthus sonchifolius]|uniref:Uncharacterized protein n=1 Tax=Smallanthus sonchifolius TaxID=185202 RepID=A0ACB9ICR3_9ASTR|nr:hypothetical protein L1987_27303 [Smallanthus sonchifolius]